MGKRDASNMSQLRPLVLLCLAIVASSAPMITTTVNYGEGCHGAIDPDLYCYTGRNKTDCEGDQGETDCLWVHERNPLGPSSSCHCSTPWWECYVKETKSACQQNPADGCSWVFGGLSSEGLFYCNYTDSGIMEQQQQTSPISHPSSLMPRVNLSAHGPEVSRIALGILHLAQDPKVTSVKDARAAGITTFDLADNYAAGKCLELFGAALQSIELDHPGWRAGIQVIAKIGELDNGDYAAGGPLPWLDTSMAYTQNITDYYLRVMGTSYLDLLIYHWPDRLMDPNEVAATFRALKDSGKVRFFGVSNFKPLQLKLLSTATQKVGIEMVTNEVAHSPWTPQTEDDGTMEDTQLREIKPLAWGPLGGNPGGGANFLFKVKWPKGSVEAK